MTAEGNMLMLDSHPLLPNITAQPSILTITLHQSKTNPFHRGHPSYKHFCESLSKYINFVSPQYRHGPVFNLGCFRLLTHCQVTSTSFRGRGGYSHYASHSFRIGATSTAAAAGIPSDSIRTLGCWHSNAYQRYIRYLTVQLVAVLFLLLLTDASSQVPWNADRVYHEQQQLTE